MISFASSSFHVENFNSSTKQQTVPGYEWLTYPKSGIHGIAALFFPSLSGCNNLPSSPVNDNLPSSSAKKNSTTHALTDYSNSASPLHFSTLSSKLVVIVVIAAAVADDDDDAVALPLHILSPLQVCNHFCDFKRNKRLSQSLSETF